MFETILALLPKITSAMASLPEFIQLVEDVGNTLGMDDQEALQDALELAQEGSDQANAELAALIAERLG